MVRSDCYLLLVVLAAAVMARTGAQVVRRGERPPLTTAVIAVEPRAGSALRTRRGRVPEKAAGYSETLADAMVDFAGACLDVNLIDGLTVSPR